MKTLSFVYDNDQLRELEALALWISNRAQLIEEAGPCDPCIPPIEKTLTECVFPALDRLGVPYWVQNSVICFAEDWRRAQREYFTAFLRSKNIVGWPVKTII